MANLEVISECFVKPQHQVEAAKQPYYLGPIDLIMLSIDPIQKGLLFSFQDLPNRPDIEPIVEKLRLSLSALLCQFYPLAGRFETELYENEHACLIYLDCNKGPGARLIHARHRSLAVDDVVSAVDVHPAVASFFDLGERAVNYDGHTKPLLSIQITELLDGAFIGFTMNHSVLDGTSFIRVVGALSEIFRSCEKGENKPIYKMYVPDGYGSIFKLPHLKHEEFITRYNPGELRERIFHFSSESMARLKKKANEEHCGENGHMISSFMALSGLVWRSIIRARNPAGHEKTSCALLMNARSRVNPPLTDDYFGNFLCQSAKLCTVEELLGQSLGRAAGVLSQHLKKSNETVGEFLKILADNPFVVQPGVEAPEYNRVKNTVVIGGGTRFDMYGPEFGMGRAVAVRMGYGNKEDGKVTANPGREGGGSVDLEICLNPELMIALEADEEFSDFACVV